MTSTTELEIQLASKETRKDWRAVAVEPPGGQKRRDAAVFRKGKLSRSMRSICSEAWINGQC